MGHGKNSKGEFKSQVPHVMLHLNPGVARHYGSQVRALDKLKNKVVILNCLILSIQIHILCVIKLKSCTDVNVFPDLIKIY